MTEWTHTVTDSPWPERNGRRCRILQPPTNGRRLIYPWHGLGKGEVIIGVENDPFMPSRSWWSCALDRRHITPIEEAP